jgi:hypothetical protein
LLPAVELAERSLIAIRWTPVPKVCSSLARISTVQ